MFSELIRPDTNALLTLPFVATSSATRLYDETSRLRRRARVETIEERQRGGHNKQDSSRIESAGARLPSSPASDIDRISAEVGLVLFPSPHVRFDSTDWI
ncbi:hypothetical protein MN608_04045 [Microdochium nivale]|nr:hypothetical protein MN608_04045 [Microdochium nivale]